MDIFDRLKAARAADVAMFVVHDGVQQLGAGTLPEAKSTARWPPESAIIARRSMPSVMLEP